MSAKRAATTELNHDNWDEDDPSVLEEMGKFKTASKEVLEKRVIRTAKRRFQGATNEEDKKGVFVGFGGFNKTQPASFDFLANLTNGNKTSPAAKSETSSLFTNKAFTNSSGAIFGAEVSPVSTTKATFGFSNHASPLFNTSLTNTQTATSIFTASKADSTVGDFPFKTQHTTSTMEPTNTDSTKTTNLTGSIMSSTLFGVTSSSMTASKTLITTTSTSSPFKIPVSSSTTIQSAFGTSSVATKHCITEGNKEILNDDKKLKYYAKLKGLNESVSDWIKKHVEETPLCILTPIFKDYEKYLKEMQDEYHEKDEAKDAKTVEPEKTAIAKSDTDNDKTPKSFSIFSANTNASPSFKPDTAKLAAFDNPSIATSMGDKQSFSFGIKTSDATNSSPSTGFTFGISTPQPTTKTTSLFSTTPNMNGGTPFSFGTGTPFSFNSNIQKPDTETSPQKNNEEEEPPKVEFTPLVEENSVYDKKCKIFVKKDGNFVDKGVATLYIKKIEDSSKYQLLVRANTNLGNILLNMILTSAIPTQRMGKNNVMMVCIATPESKPPPTPILIRVKTSEEADELLETLNKYKT